MKSWPIAKRREECGISNNWSRTFYCILAVLVERLDKYKVNQARTFSWPPTSAWTALHLWRRFVRYTPWTGIGCFHCWVLTGMTAIVYGSAMGHGLLFCSGEAALLLCRSPQLLEEIDKCPSNPTAQEQGLLLFGAHLAHKRALKCQKI